MASKMTAWGRMYAWLQSEVPATLLEAYRRASLPVFEVMDLAEARRLECATDGLDPWTLPPATRAELLCAWNAFVLQTLGNDILDADYDASPVTAGYVPPFTARQVLSFYAEVEEWLTRARQAHANPDFWLDVQVPAELPVWKTSTLEPASPSLLQGILRAMRSVSEHAAAAMAFLPETVHTAEQQAQLNHIRHLYASAESKARYALDLHGTGSSRDVQAKLEPYTKEAIRTFYELGQLIADPSLVGSVVPPSFAAPRSLPAPRPADPLPGEPDFNAWCLTDPQAAAVLQHNQRAQKALRKMWKLDPDPATTLALHAEIRSAFDLGHITYASTGTERVGYFHCCPWGPVYVANHSVTLAGTELKTMQRFVYEVGALNTAQAFRRRILVGNFQETGDLSYAPQWPRA